MKKIIYAWIEQVIEFDSMKEAHQYVYKQMQSDKDFIVISEDINEDGTDTLRVRKQYNNNMFP